MLPSIPRTWSVLNFFVSTILICFYLSQMLELSHTFLKMYELMLNFYFVVHSDDETRRYTWLSLRFGINTILLIHSDTMP